MIGAEVGLVTESGAPLTATLDTLPFPSSGEQVIAPLLGFTLVTNWPAMQGPPVMGAWKAPVATPSGVPAPLPTSVAS